jgi:hypothetical protein
VHAGGSHFSAIRLFFKSLAFVVLFATFAQAEPNFDETALEKDLQRHKCQAIIFCRFGKFADFPPIQQQFAFALAGVIVDAGLSILGNVTVTQPHFFVVNASVAFIQRDLVIADAFDLTAGQYDAAVQFIQHVKFVASTTVAADDLTIG